jgi:hypothetical protein
MAPQVISSNSDNIRSCGETVIETPKDPMVIERRESRSQRLGFLDLVDDILHLICSELYATSRTSLLAIAQVSRSLNIIATPYIFRNLFLSPGLQKSQERKAYEVLLQGLEGQAGSKLLNHVRHLCFGGYDSAASLEVILEKCQNVRTFKYDYLFSLHFHALNNSQLARPYTDAYSHLACPAEDIA